MFGSGTSGGSDILTCFLGLALSDQQLFFCCCCNYILKYFFHILPCSKDNKYQTTITCLILQLLLRRGSREELAAVEGLLTGDETLWTNQFVCQLMTNEDYGNRETLHSIIYCTLDIPFPSSNGCKRRRIHLEKQNRQNRPGNNSRMWLN